jgi:hypothetical protein
MFYPHVLQVVQRWLSAPAANGRISSAPHRDTDAVLRMIEESASRWQLLDLCVRWESGRRATTSRLM